MLPAGCLYRNLVFIHGKGGVGKTSVANAVAMGLSLKGKRTLLIEFENPTLPAGEIRSIAPHLWHLNAEGMSAFEEYIALKTESLGPLAGLARTFTHNKLIQYLAKAAPGVREVVLLGKAWYERNNYDHVVLDMPSTGYAIAMFQSTVNFSKLFKGSPLARDAEGMRDTIGNPNDTSHVIVALPEEMPLRESLELSGHLAGIFPENPAAFIANKIFPGVPTGTLDDQSGSARREYSDQSGSARREVHDQSGSPFSSTISEYIARRRLLEARNLGIWNGSSIRFAKIELFSPANTDQTALFAKIAGVLF